MNAEMLHVFGNGALLAWRRRSEALLAWSQKEGRSKPNEAVAKSLAYRADSFPDVPELAATAARAGTLGMPLFARLRTAGCSAHSEPPGLASLDTAMVQQIEGATALLCRDLAALSAAVATLADAASDWKAPAWTLLQPAVPTWFHLRAARWTQSIKHARRRFEREAAAIAAFRLENQAGPLSGTQERRAAVTADMAVDHGLASPLTPWYPPRVTFAKLAHALTAVMGVTGMIARDVSVLSQSSAANTCGMLMLGFAAEPDKQDAEDCRVAVSAASRAPELVASAFAGSISEHGLDLVDWRAQAEVLAELFCLAHVAMTTILPTIERLGTARS